MLPKDDGLTRRGFTGHETLAAIGLVHMNGRIYDPALGRFLQADPYVQSGSDLQGLNRYAYVLNNPLSAVDPSGHYVFRLAAAVFTAGAGPVTKVIAFTVAGFADAMVAGADFGQAVRSGMISGITAAAFSSLAVNLPVAETFEDQLLQGASYGFVGGVTSVIGGGRFGHGFVSAGLGAGFGGPLVKRLVERGLSVATARTIAATLIGGTSSAATGGKFANGAAWAAFSAAASLKVAEARSRASSAGGDPHSRNEALSNEELISITMDADVEPSARQLDRLSQLMESDPQKAIRYAEKIFGLKTERITQGIHVGKGGGTAEYFVQDGGRIEIYRGAFEDYDGNPGVLGSVIFHELLHDVLPLTDSNHARIYELELKLQHRFMYGEKYLRQTKNMLRYYKSRATAN